MKWKQPPIIKIYEALGAVADGRIKADGNSAQVYSSSGNKFYTVTFEPESQSIMANDNGSYWQRYLGYPAITFLLLKNILPYDAAMADHLKNIVWKDINQQFKNDFTKTLKHIESHMEPSAVQELREYAQELLKAVHELDLQLLGKRAKPPEGY